MTYRAKLENVLDRSRQRAAERFEAVFGAGGEAVVKEEVILDGAAARGAAGGLEIAFARSGGKFEAALGALDLPADWTGGKTLRLTAVCVGRPVHIDLVLVNARCRMSTGADLGPGQAAELVMELLDLPLAGGKEPPCRPTAVRVEAAWEGPADTRTVVVNDLLLETVETGGAGRQPCVDRFGQRMTATWPGKIADEADLRSRAGVEAAEMAKTAPPPERDEFGGWTDGPRFEAGGFFRVDRDADGRWWLVDPTGRAFWSIGLTGVRTFEGTKTEGREAIFEALPARDGPHAAAWLGPHETYAGLSFYRWNVLRKYGGMEAWRDRVLERFGRWGVNTIACWSEEIMLRQQRVPFVAFARSHGPGAPMTSNRFPDVYDPAWEPWMERTIVELTAPWRDNRWLLGYFIDNEQPWHDMRLLHAPAGAAVRQAWAASAKGKYGHAARAAAAWGRDVPNWDAVAAMGAADVPAEGALRDDMTAFEAEFTDRYQGTIARLLNKHDPNHLYLGCRFVRRLPPRAVAHAAGKHQNVVTVNCYAGVPPRDTFQDWHDWTGRPILIGEHHFPLASPRQFPPLYRDFTPEERRVMYYDYVHGFAAMPFSVGSHWFQHADQPLTGRSTNGENQPVGFVDLTDNPHEELVDALRRVAAEVYPVHARSV
jgi:hypothetical protein